MSTAFDYAIERLSRAGGAAIRGDRVTVRARAPGAAVFRTFLGLVGAGAAAWFFFNHHSAFEAFPHGLWAAVGALSLLLFISGHTPDVHTLSRPVPVDAETQSPSINERLAMVDKVCTALLNAIAKAPRVLQEFAGRPEQAVRQLQYACHTLGRSEARLRALHASIVENRTQGPPAEILALQRRQLEPLEARLARYESEGALMLRSLEGLLTEVVRVSAAVPTLDVPHPLRRNMHELTERVEALADALEEGEREGADAGGNAAQPVSAAKVRL